MNIYRIDYSTPDYGTDAILLHEKKFTRGDLENMWKEFAVEHNLPRGGNYMFYKLSREEKDVVMDLDERLHAKWPDRKTSFFSCWLVEKKGFVKADVVAYYPPTDI